MASVSGQIQYNFLTLAEMDPEQVDNFQRIYDLAERMIRLSGRRPGTDIEIRITGVRPGEKLAEELRTLEEVECPTVHPSIMRVVPTCIDNEVLEQGIVALAAMAAAFDEEQCARELRWLASTVPRVTFVVPAH